METNVRKTIITRINIAYAAILLAAVVVIGRIIYLQYIAPPEKNAEDLLVKNETIPARRGSILATDGRPMAVSIPYYQIRMDCMAPAKDTFDKYVGALATDLAKLYKNKSAQSYKNELIKARKGKKRYYAIGNRTIDYSELETLKKFPLFRKGAYGGGLIVEQKNKRDNPYGRLAYRTIGFINSLGEGVGIEESFDYYLKGKDGSRRIQKVGQEWRPLSLDNDVEPVDGMDIRTTLNIEIQEIAENALRNQLSKSDVFEGATAVVMEVKTGAVRAIVNMYKRSDGTFDESFNYAIGRPSEPGSTFKLATLICLLEDGYVTLETPIDVGNGRFRYYNHTYSDVGRGLGAIDVLTAFEHSSNVAFVKLAIANYGNNEQKFVDRIINMKFTDKMNLDIKASSVTRMLDPKDPGWNKLTLPSMAIGYAIDITPMHTLTLYNAVANNGVMMKPYFIESMERDGKVVEQFYPTEITGSICSKSTLREAKKALVSVVTNGGVKKYNDKRYQIAGKTGTARILLENGKYSDSEGYRRHQASFAGFFPAENPKYSAVVVLYTGKTKSNFYGGAWAAPVFKAISDEIYAMNPEWKDPVQETKDAIDNPHINGGIAEQEKIAVGKCKMKNKPEIPQRGWVSFSSDSTHLISKTLDIKTATMPDITGFGLKDAIFLLENEGYKVKFEGYGSVVSQDPPPGSKMTSKQEVKLILSDRKNKMKKK